MRNRTPEMPDVFVEPLPMNELLAPSETSREILFQAVQDNKPRDTVSPEFFIANFMQFVCMVIANGKPSMDTIHTYKKHINAFLEWCLRIAKVSPFNLSEKHLELYRNLLYQENTVNGTKYNDNTISNRFIAIRAFYAAAVKNGILQANPCEDIRTKSIPINDLPFSYYKMSEIKKIVDYVKTHFSDELERCRNLVCIYLMAIAGLRCVEVHRANIEDINWNDFTMVVHGKGHNGMVYLEVSTCQVLQEYLDILKKQPFPIIKEGGVSPLIISNANRNLGARLSREAIRWNINKVLKGANMKLNGFSCHIFRHSCATALYENTRDLRVVQDVLRHRNPDVTARYAHVVEQLKNRPTSALGNMLRP